MTIQSDALAGAVIGHQNLTPAERLKMRGKLWRDPLIASPAVYDLALKSMRDDPALAAHMETMKAQELIVLDEHPKTARAKIRRARKDRTPGRSRA